MAQISFIKDLPENASKAEVRRIIRKRKRLFTKRIAQQLGIGIRGKKRRVIQDDILLRDKAEIIKAHNKALAKRRKKMDKLQKAGSVFAALLLGRMVQNAPDGKLGAVMKEVNKIEKAVEEKFGIEIDLDSLTDITEDTDTAE